MVSVILLPVVGLYHLSLGQVDISFSETWKALFSYDESVLNQVIVHEFRLPRLIIGLIAGASLSVSGLMMQTLFNNPLAGPYVLGINSGASLFVAMATMSGFYLFSQELGIVFSALFGAFVFGVIVLLFAKLVKSGISLLLVGLMIGSFSGAIVSLLQSMAELKSLKVFTMWSLGSLQNVELSNFVAIIPIFILGLFLSFLLIKPLDQLVIGENRAVSLGVGIQRTRVLVIIATAILTGVVTAYCGPIGFVGLAVPNLLRIGLKSNNHRLLIPASIIFGALFVILCDIIIQHLEVFIHVPINVLTIIIGAPVVVFVILKKLG